MTAQVTDLNGNQSALATQLVTVAETGPSVTIDKVDGNDLIEFRPRPMPPPAWR